MSDPTTTNVLLAVPTRGSDVGTWDVPVNANSTAIDGFIGGVVSIALTNAPVTLSAPTGSVTPGAGPYQSQNRILKFTGTLSGNVAVTLPMPGEYTVQNLTTGNFVVTFVAVGAGNVVATPQGSVMKIWNDGTDVWLIKNQIPGALTFLGGVNALPAWITSCTLRPFLLCDGTVYNYSTYGALGNLYGGSFGGNGITTFGVQDLRGRVPLAYDGTGTRITTAGCGINGQTLGAAGGEQTHTITIAELAAHKHSVYLKDPGHTHTLNASGASIVVSSGSSLYNGGPYGQAISVTVNSATTGITVGSVNGTANDNQTANAGGGGAHNNVQPAQVGGIWIVAT